MRQIAMRAIRLLSTGIGDLGLTRRSNCRFCIYREGSTTLAVGSCKSTVLRLGHWMDRSSTRLSALERCICFLEIESVRSGKGLLVHCLVIFDPVLTELECVLKTVASTSQACTAGALIHRPQVVSNGFATRDLELSYQRVFTSIKMAFGLNSQTRSIRPSPRI